MNGDNNGSEGTASSTVSPSGDAGARETEEPRVAQSWVERLKAALQNAQTLLTVAAAIIVGLANVVSAIEKQWLLLIVSLIGVVLALSILVLADRSKWGGKWIRRAAIGAVIGLPASVIVFFFLYSLLPRIRETGTTVAVANFDGPTFPKPYEACQPSAFVADALTDIAEEFHNINVFEISDTLTPDMRWSGIIAQSLGLLDGADVLIYGRYGLLKDAKNSTGDADEVAFLPRVESTPSNPLPVKFVPISRWQLQKMTLKISDLCSTDSKLIEQVKIVALATAADELITESKFDAAGEAVREAKEAAQTLYRAETSKTDPCSANGGYTAMPPFAASYLASLDNRLGHYVDAKREYSCAASEQVSAAALIDLGVLRIDTGETKLGFQALDAAVHADPTSVAALATRSLYERENGRANDAALDLDRAIRLQPQDNYDRIALSYALYERAGANECGVKIARALRQRGDFDRASSNDALLKFAQWEKDPSEKLKLLNGVLQRDPYGSIVNYRIGILLKGDDRRAYLLRAQLAPAITDTAYNEQGNASNELAYGEQATDRNAARADYNRALQAYAESLKINPNNSETYWLRGTTLLAFGEFDKRYARWRSIHREAARADFDAVVRLRTGWSYQLASYLNSGLLACTLKNRKSCHPSAGASAHTRQQYKYFRDVYNAAKDDDSRWLGRLDKKFSDRACAYENIDI